MNLISEVSYQQIRLVVAGYSQAPATPRAARTNEGADVGRCARAHGDLSRGSRAAVRSIRRRSSRLPRPSRRWAASTPPTLAARACSRRRSWAFAIRVAEESRIPVHIFHLKIRGKNNWGTVGKYVATIEAARKRGLDVTANQYPYTAMQHQWSAFFPVWARAGGPQEFAAILKDPAGRKKIKDDPDFRTWASEHGSWEGHRPRTRASAAEQAVRGQATLGDRGRTR